MVLVVRNTAAMIAGMDPALAEGEYVFCTTSDPSLAQACFSKAIATFQEREGTSFVLPVDTAASLGFDHSVQMRCITLNVYSALDGVGLTAAVASALAGAEISCNMVAAFHHDHVFIPSARAVDALAILRGLSAGEPEHGR